VVKYFIDSDADFPCLTKRTPIIDMAHITTADMVNADCAHNRRQDTLCPVILVLFDAGLGSRSFYERNVVCVWSCDNFDVFYVSVSKATHNI